MSLSGSADVNASLNVSSGASIKMAPGGSITLTAPEIDMAGLLEAPAGTISLTATQRDLTVENGGRILATGYNKQDIKPIKTGFPLGYTALAGGTVTLTASSSSAPDTGDLILKDGSLIDVSGSETVTTYVSNALGNPTALTVAGNAGTISLTAKGNLQLDGTLKGRSFLSGLQGGTLTIDRTNLLTALAVSSSIIGKYVDAGFDALTFQSENGLALSGSDTSRHWVARSLVLDAPSIEGSGDSVNLGAAYVELKNTYKGVAQTPAVGGSTALALSGDWIDVTGSVQLSGFRTVTLDAQRDIRLTDRKYNNLAGYFWEGKLTAPGDLLLKADHIYPTTLSSFTLHSDGKVTILRSDTPTGGQIYSAGGSLTIEASSIEDRGYLAAPMGQIDLEATGRVYLAENSVITVAGSIPVSYGDLNDVFWTIPDKLDPGSEGDNRKNVTGVPDRSITISGSEVIAKAGSLLDASGRGSIISCQFQSGIQGTNNPFNGSYVIVPGGAYSLPGDAVYLEGMAGLPAGVYSLLPMQYAFLPGALVVTPVSNSIVSGQRLLASDGHTIVAGYRTFSGTDISSSKMSAYEITSASEMLTRGYFNMGGSSNSSFSAGYAGSLNLRGYSGGNAGTVTVQGSSSILNGEIRAAGLSGYRGGSVRLSGTDVYVERYTVPLDENFDFGSELPDDLKGSLHIAASSISGKGFETISLGEVSAASVSNNTSTRSVTIQAGSTLEAANIKLSALSGITLESDTHINASSGAVELFTPGGTVSMASGSSLSAPGSISLTMRKLDLRSGANIQSTNGLLNIVSGTGVRVENNSMYLVRGNLVLESDGYTGPENATDLYLKSSFWSRFGEFGNVRLSGASVDFLGSVQLTAGNSFTIDAARIAVEAVPGDSNPSISIAAPLLNIQNTGDVASSSSLANTGTLTLSGTAISAGPGQVLLDGFATTNFNALSDLTFMGNGGLKTGGNLNLTAARLTTWYYQDSATSYTPVDYSIEADGTVRVDRSQGTAGNTSVPGGKLSITGKSIDDSGIVDVSSGYVTFTATGSDPGDGIILRSGSGILARGSAYGSGGVVSLVSDAGSITMQQGSYIDVSAGGQGDAGTISISAPTGGGSAVRRFARQGERRGRRFVPPGYATAL